MLGRGPGARGRRGRAVRGARAGVRSLARSGVAACVLAGVFVAAPAAGAAALSVPPGSTVGERFPVLLVPGWFDTDRALAALRIRLVASGWSGNEVLAVRFRHATGSNREHAQEIAVAVDSLLRASGAPQVDIVAHSMGGLATRLYLRERGGAYVRRVVLIATPNRGTYASYVAWGAGAKEMRPGSAFLDSLNAGAPLPEGVRGITVRTVMDAHIIPGESATLPPLPDHRVCCPTHEGLLRDAEVFRIIVRFLEEPA